MSTIVQNFTPIDVTVADISVSVQKKLTSNFIVGQTLNIRQKRIHVPAFVL